MTKKTTNTPTLPAAPPEDNLMRVTVQIGARRFDEDLAVQATIRPDVASLNDAMASHPARFAEWAMLEALARGELDDTRRRIDVAQTDLKELEARVYVELTSDGAAKLTVDGVKARVTIDERRLVVVRAIQALEAAALGAKDALEKIAVGRKTMEERRDCLMELARNWRKEMDGKLQVREPQDMGQFKPGSRA